MLKNPKLIAASAFLAGGVVVGGITLGTAVAHGAGTPGAGKGLSDAQYTAKNAWVQSVTTSATLSIPSGDRLTITQADGGGIECTVTASVNGTAVSYNISTSQDGTWQQ